MHFEIALNYTCSCYQNFDKLIWEISVPDASLARNSPIMWLSCEPIKFERVTRINSLAKSVTCHSASAHSKN